jgi:hypothetical protein
MSEAVTDTEIAILGIRHHGPGSARSLLAAFDSFRPECILVEGPAEGEALLDLVLDDEMRPPVALLAFVPEHHKHAIYYPFADFSPEWQALRYGMQHKIPLRFIDMPLAHVFGLALKKAEAVDAANVSGEERAADDVCTESSKHDEYARTVHRDPLGELAKAAGFADGERWWNSFVEERQHPGDVFRAVLAAMQALRADLPAHPDAAAREEELRREAFMRLAIRRAKKDGYKRIAVVCGAWHAPALVPEAWPTLKEDQAVTKGLPRAKVECTWIPWTYGRLAFQSGYGAGIESPGWYHCLWNHPQTSSGRWIVQVARLLRKNGLDASSAQAIDALRTAETLAVMRGRALPGLEDLNEACLSVLCGGQSAPMSLVAKSLVVGETLGQVPARTALAPLVADLQREQKRLRLKASASSEVLTLDLRNDNDLQRSYLLHRLRLLGVDWGQPRQASRSKGTFKEEWQVEWKPEFSLTLVERGAWGGNVCDAAEAWVLHRIKSATGVDDLIAWIADLFLAGLTNATGQAMDRLRDLAALSGDIAPLMRAIVPLARTLRYGDVRQTDAHSLHEVIGGLTERICVALPLVAGSLDDEASRDLVVRIDGVEESLRLLAQESWSAAWREAVDVASQAPNVDGLVAGRCARLLLDSGALAEGSAPNRFALGLSGEPMQAARWLEGFFERSGTVLIHDDRLWGLVLKWVNDLPRDIFDAVLPLVRRTFSTFAPSERRMLGEKVKGASTSAAEPPTLVNWHEMRARRAMHGVAQLLGLQRNDA